MSVAAAFGAPNVLLFNSFEDRNSSGAARRAGAVRIATEIGGPKPIRTTIEGVTRLLHWAGIVRQASTPAPPPALIEIGRDSDFVYALRDGTFEPAASLGDVVEAGGLAGHIHDLMRPLDPPLSVHFSVSGIVVCMRGAGLVATADHLMHLGTEPGSETVAAYRAASKLLWLPAQLGPRPAARRPRKAKP